MKFDPTVGYFSKFNSETFNISYSFANDLDDGETLSSCTITISNSNCVDCTSSMITTTSVSSPVVIFTISGGTSDETYEIKLVGISDASNTFIHYIKCEVFGSISLNSKLGDINSNSYVTLQEANNYIRNKYGHSSTWDELTTEAKKRVLIESAIVIDSFNFNDEKYYNSQPMQFPRSGHEIKTGNCETPITATVFRNSNLYSSTYNKYPTNYWKYGTVHITSGTPLRDTRVIDESNAVNGSITLASPFSNTPTTNTNFKIFAPLDSNIKNAQCEQAMFIIKRSANDTLSYYSNAGAGSVKIGDVEVKFSDSINKSMSANVSTLSKKLLSRWIRKGLRVGRA